MAHFDWYAASIPDYPGVLADLFMTMEGAHDIKRSRGGGNYAERSVIATRDDDVLCTIMHGGQNPDPHAFATGVNAAQFASITRTHYADRHRVSRVDSAEDIRTDFSAVHAALQALARKSGLRGHTQLPDNADDGATYNIGSPKSATMVRAYEKGKELAKKAGSAEGIDLGVIRFELQFRPQKDAKSVAATLSPEEFWGSTPWTRAIARQHLDSNPARVVLRPKLATTFERRHKAFLKQYGPHLLDYLKRNGDDPETVGRLLFTELGVFPSP